ncbi:MAG: hypothetical protein J5586_06265 [Clostridia bacterium]|nr:hypothetical protein [Clostridia bacterium]
MKKSSKAIIIVLAALLSLVVLFCAAASAFAYKNTARIITALETSDEPEDDARENDVCIGDEYWIRSTQPISDAYISGDSTSLDDRQKETMKMAKDVLESVVKDDMTPFEKERAVYLWLTTRLKSETGMLTVIPTTSEDSDNPYGVLKYRSAVCVGYATTFRLFMHMLGIECMVVHDTSLSHSWDIVKLDGEWYHTDCYFDSDEGTYRHFNLSDAIMAGDHEWDRSFFPKAEGLKYNPAVQSAETVEDVYAIPAFAKAKLDEGETSFSCRVEGGIAREDEPVASAIASKIAETVMQGYDNKGFEYYWADLGGGDYVLCMFANDYESYGPVLDEEQESKVDEAMEDAFGDMYVPGGEWYDDVMNGEIGG